MLIGKNPCSNMEAFFASNDKVYAFKKKCKIPMVTEVRTCRR